jgi:hypothetical protein
MSFARTVYEPVCLEYGSRVKISSAMSSAKNSWPV